MGLPVSYTITSQSGCGSIIFEDTSAYGTGSSSTPSVDEVTGTQIVITTSDGVAHTFNNFLPSDTVNAIQLFAVDLGYSEIIPDQIINVSYTVYGASGTVLGSNTHPELLVCNFISCFYGKVQQAIAPGCCNGNVLLDQLAVLWILFIAIQAAFQKNSCCAQDDIEDLNKQCSNIG